MYRLTAIAWCACCGVLLADDPFSEMLERKQPEVQRIDVTLSHRFTKGEQTKFVTFITLIPNTIPGRQTVREVSYSLRPDKVFEKQGNTYAVFILDQLEQPLTIDIRIIADLSRYDLATAIANDAVPNLAEHEDVDAWLSEERNLESNNPSIKSAANRAVGENRLEIVRSIMSIVCASLEYKGYDKASRGAAQAIRDKVGDCGEFSDLFVALCRARGIPARTCLGFLTRPARPGDTMRHRWAEFYLTELGWIPVDPLHTSLGTATFDQLENQYLCVTHERNDAILDNHEYSYFRWYGGPLKDFEDWETLHQ